MVSSAPVCALSEAIYADFQNLFKHFIRNGNVSFHSFKCSWKDLNMGQLHTCCPLKTDPSLWYNLVIQCILDLFHNNDNISVSSTFDEMGVPYKQVIWNIAAIFALYCFHRTRFEVTNLIRVSPVVWLELVLSVERLCYCGDVGSEAIHAFLELFRNHAFVFAFYTGGVHTMNINSCCSMWCKGDKNVVHREPLPCEEIQDPRHLAKISSDTAIMKNSADVEATIPQCTPGAILLTMFSIGSPESLPSSGIERAPLIWSIYDKLAGVPDPAACIAETTNVGVLSDQQLPSLPSNRALSVVTNGRKTTLVTVKQRKFSGTSSAAVFENVEEEGPLTATDEGDDVDLGLFFQETSSSFQVPKPARPASTKERPRVSKKQTKAKVPSGTPWAIDADALQRLEALESTVDESGAAGASVGSNSVMVAGKSKRKRSSTTSTSPGRRKSNAVTSGVKKKRVPASGIVPGSAALDMLASLEQQVGINDLADSNCTTVVSVPSQSEGRSKRNRKTGNKKGDKLASASNGKNARTQERLNEGETEVPMAVVSTGDGGVVSRGGTGTDGVAGSETAEVTAPWQVSGDALSLLEQLEGLSD